MDEQDIHQTIVIGIAAVCGSSAQVDSTMENIINFVEDNTDAELINIERDEICHGDVWHAKIIQSLCCWQL